MITPEQWFGYVGPITVTVLGLIAGAAAAVYFDREHRRIDAMERAERERKAAE